jgi:hypothetical protein
VATAWSSCPSDSEGAPISLIDRPALERDTSTQSHLHLGRRDVHHDLDPTRPTDAANGPSVKVGWRAALKDSDRYPA